MKELRLRYPIYPDLTIPNGALTPDLGCQACWTFYVGAESNRLSAGNSISEQMIEVVADDEGSMPWMNKQYENLARSIAMLYGLESPDDFQKFWPLVTIQCLAMGYQTPHWEYSGRTRLRNIEV
jgi:hypothetical protein